MPDAVRCHRVGRGRIWLKLTLIPSQYRVVQYRDFWKNGEDMKVTGVKTYVIENEPGVRTGGGGQTEQWYVGGKYFLILELSTDEGIVGIGEKLTGSSFTGKNDMERFQVSNTVSS